MITVIIPTYNRMGLLARQLDALASQTLDDSFYEILVIDDGSTDGTAGFLQEWAMRKLTNRFFVKENGGPASARNLGIKMAKGEIIAFTDDDCEVDYDWLAEIQSAMNSDLLGVQGATYTDRAEITPLTHQIDNETGHNSTPTCNAAYRKSVLLDLGGFDETFPNPHNEDTDISWRVQERGEMLFCPGVRVYHPPRVDTFRKVAGRMKIMECEFTLFRKNPDLYKKYRDNTPFRHIYVEVFFKTIGYHFLSRFKSWDKPKQMLQGIMLTILWWWSLLIKLPRYYRMQRALDRSG